MQEKEQEVFEPAQLVDGPKKCNTGGQKPDMKNSTVLIIVLLAIVIGVSCGLVGYYLHDVKTKYIYQDNVVYKAPEGFEKFDLLTRTMSLADSSYYDDVDYDAMDKVLSVAFIDALDDFSSMSAAGGGTASANVGLGISLHITNYNEYYVDQVYEGAPAEGILQRGDKLIDLILKSYQGIADANYINVRLNNLDYSYLPSCFSGPEGTLLKLRIERDGVQTVVDIVKGAYTITKATYVNDLGGGIPNDVGYIKLSSFTDTAAEDFKKCIEAFTADNNQVLILDLRNNGGGSVSILSKIASYLISDGNGTKEVPIIKFNNDASITYSSEDSTKFIGKPIYVLTNSNTASASEALLSAMMYYGTATGVLGTTTFGKGIGQTSRTLTDDDAVVYTVSLTTGRYYTFVEESAEYPDGLKCIHGEGIEPTVKFSNADTNAYHIDMSQDKLVQKVAELMAEGE